MRFYGDLNKLSKEQNKKDKKLQQLKMRDGRKKEELTRGVTS